MGSNPAFVATFFSKNTQALPYCIVSLDNSVHEINSQKWYDIVSEQFSFFL